MAANYPTIVRKFSPHADGTEYVMAAHMNAAQDEITAVQSTLGTKPHVRNRTNGSPTAYSTVGARLDSIQTTQDTQQTQINGLLDDSKTGWALPIASVQDTGTSIPATVNTHSVQPSDWYNLTWRYKVLDTNGAFSQNSTYLTIPQTGWWILTSRTMMHDPSVPDTVQHILWGRVRVRSTHPGQVTDYDLAAADSTAPGGAEGWHRLTMACAWNFYQGDQVMVQVRHDFLPTNSGQPTPTKSSQTAMSRTQLTYIRGLPATVGVMPQFDDEVGT